MTNSPPDDWPEQLRRVEQSYSGLSTSIFSQTQRSIPSVSSMPDVRIGFSRGAIKRGSLLREPHRLPPRSGSCLSRDVGDCAGPPTHRSRNHRVVVTPALYRRSMTSRRRRRRRLLYLSELLMLGACAAVVLWPARGTALLLAAGMVKLAIG